MTETTPVPPLTLGRRLLCAAIAFAGSTAYALSFWLVHRGGDVTAAAKAVGMAAALSWVLFGGMLLLVTRGRPSILLWADVCLLTMTAGIAVKTVSLSLNLAVYWFKPQAASSVPMAMHVGVLVVANLVMALVFIRRAMALGLNPFVAAALWFIVLNGLFILIFRQVAP